MAAVTIGDVADRRAGRAMGSATRITVGVFGTIAGLAGIEHGVGEIRQGSVAPEGVVFESWPDSELFRILAGEPAMTVVPNLLLAGVLTVFVSLLFTAWAIAFMDKTYGGWILVAVSVLLLLVGGGFGPPLLGTILGVAAIRAQNPRRSVRAESRAGRVLTRSWPWLMGAAVASWLTVMPGTVLLSFYFGYDSPVFVAVVTASAFGLLFLTIRSALIRDAVAGRYAAEEMDRL